MRSLSWPRLRWTWTKPMFEIQGIDHVALAVRDVERAAKWYQDVLGLLRMHEDTWGSFPAMVGAGGTSLALFPVQGDDPGDPPGKNVITMRHIAFRVDRANFEKAKSDLRHRGIEIESQDHEIAHSIYFRDPDGHEIEITTYEV